MVETSRIRQRLARGFNLDARGEHQLAYIPGLDGIRAFAVLSVMAYHAGLSLPGGFMGVDTFFVLSGFLITTLLVEEWRQRDTIRLGAFWARRARRLLPALLLMVLFVAFYPRVIALPGTYPGLRLDALSSIFYVANWHFVLTGADYFVRTGPVSPLTHTWSLAIEEQFYLVWPLVVLAILKFTRSLRVLMGVCIVGAIASAAEMAVLYNRGSGVNRLYYGTDTHAQCLLVGATLALTLAIVSQRRWSSGWMPPAGAPAVGGDPAWAATGVARTVLTWAGVIGLLGTAYMWGAIGGNDPFMYQRGFMIAALLTAAVIASVVCAQREVVAQLLAWAPFRFLGRISYGMYLWHFPLFLWIDHARTGLLGTPLFFVRTMATIAVATVSFYLVEQPIRHGTFFRDWRAWLATPVAALVVIITLVAATVAPSQVAFGISPPSGSAALYHGTPVRVLWLGDSTALALGFPFGEKAIEHSYDITTLDEGILGCGVTVAQYANVLGVLLPFRASCNQSTTQPSQMWTAQWQHWVDTFHPNVVAVLAGRWEVTDVVHNGQRTNILNRGYAEYVEGQLQKAVDVATSKGARVVLFTAPCYDAGEQPDGSPWPEDQLLRVQIYNQLVRWVAAANPTKVSVFDLYHLACPNGHYTTELNNISIRTNDGIHFTLDGGEYLGREILPALVVQGRQQMAHAAASAATTAPSP